MDPLSMTASIVAVLKLTTTLMSYCTDIRNSTAEQKKLAEEASNLYVLLIRLRGRVEETQSSNDIWFTQARLIGSENGPLEQLKRMLEKLVTQMSMPGTKDRIKSALLWKFTKSDVDATLSRIERLKSSIHLALSDDAFKLTQAIHEKTTDIRVGIQQLLSHTSREMHVKLSTWLQVPDPSTNYHAALKKRHPGTGTWLLAGPTYQAWQRSASALLWLHGMPGCGKTVLNTTILEQILARTAGQQDTAVGYFYFDFDDSQKQSTSIAARSLLLQLALQQADGLPALEQLYQRCGQGQQQPADQLVQALLFTMMNEGRHTFIMLDALDECRDREELLAFVKSLRTAQQRRLCLLVTSRRERDIETSLDLIADHTINIQSAVVDADINMYVRSRLATDTKLKKWSASVRDEIVDQLMKKANGMFRWAYCQLEALRKCRQLGALKSALSELPRDLDSTYTRILQTIEANGDLPNAITVLRWLCFSHRPLRLSELVETLAFQKGEDIPSRFDPDERLPEPNEVQEICSSLISFDYRIQSDDYDSLNEEDHVNRRYSIEGSAEYLKDRVAWVRLAHFSVKEYLLSGRCRYQVDFQVDRCRNVIGETCLNYLQHLSEEGVSSEVEVHAYPLADYSAQYWWQHVQEPDPASQGATTLTTTDRIYNLLTNSQFLLMWQRLYDAEMPRQKRNFSKTLYHLASPIYYAALFGLSEVVQQMLARGANFSTLGGQYGHTLRAAASGGHDKAVQILFNASADVSLHGGCRDHALWIELKHRHDEVAQKMLDAGADINARGGISGNALQVASLHGHNKVVQILIDAGADVDAQGGVFGTALQAASYRGHDKVVQLLIDAGADVNAQGGVFGTALQAASYRGHDKVVQLLIDADADFNAQRECASRSALYIALAFSYDKAAQKMLDAGADINARGGISGNALQVASLHGHNKVVQILIDAGADVNAQGGVFGTALQAASYRGHVKVVQLLLDAGANVDVKGRYYNPVLERLENGSALQAARHGNHDGVVQLLCRWGATDGDL